ncbi:LPS export ABC transporter periplasmic protein LptC [Candidatus Babeliales bacterium]|nr:LPS export ABC transporter periplasmic protein LptC [Candidatus Babeliales bacterium]MCF7899827.1 LPS export ABC transporter periplasmic protein LptC [Candidatus Babeliales bacterium]
MVIKIKSFLKNLIKSSYILIPIIVSIFFLFYFSKEENINKNIKEKKLDNKNIAQIIIQDFNFQQVGDNNNSNTYNWKINSEIAKLYKETNQVECTKIICKLIKDNKEISILKSEKALIDKNNNTAYLEKLSGQFYNNINLNAQNAQIDLKDQNIIMTDGVKTEIIQPYKLRQP